MDFDFEKIYGKNGREKTPLEQSVHDAIMEEACQNASAREEGRRLGKETAPGIAKSILESGAPLSEKTREGFEAAAACGIGHTPTGTFIDQTPTLELLKMIEAEAIPNIHDDSHESGLKRD